MGWRQNLVALIDGTESILKWEKLFYASINPTIEKAIADGSRSKRLFTTLQTIDLPFANTKFANIMSSKQSIFPLIMSKGKGILNEKAKFQKVTTAVKALQKNVVNLGNTLQAGNNPLVANNAAFNAIVQQLVSNHAGVGPVLSAYNDKIESIKKLLASSSAKDTGPQLGSGRRASIVIGIEDPLLRAVMTNPKYIAIKQSYKDFAHNSAYVGENYDFVEAIMKLKQMEEKKEDYDTVIVPEMERIYQLYVPEGVDQQVNLAATERLALLDARGTDGSWKPNGAPIRIANAESVWSEAETAILFLQQHDVYQRFCVSAGHVDRKLVTLSARKVYEERKIAEYKTKHSKAHRGEQNEYDLYDDDDYSYEYVPNVRAIDDYGQQQQHEQLSGYDDWQRDYHSVGTLYDPMSMVVGMAVFALIICFAFMVSASVGFGCYFLGRMSLQTSGGKLDEIMYDAVDQRGDNDENV